MESSALNFKVRDGKYWIYPNPWKKINEVIGVIHKRLERDGFAVRYVAGQGLTNIVGLHAERDLMVTVYSNVINDNMQKPIEICFEVVIESLMKQPLSKELYKVHCGFNNFLQEEIKKAMRSFS